MLLRCPSYISPMGRAVSVEERFLFLLQPVLVRTVADCHAHLPRLLKMFVVWALGCHGCQTHRVR